MRDRHNYPLWVKLGLFGVHTRSLALAFAWGSAFFTLVCLIGGFGNQKLFYGLCFATATCWFWAAINWVDSNDTW